MSDQIKIFLGLEGRPKVGKTVTVTMDLETYQAELAAARAEGARSGKYEPLIELVKKITSWHAPHQPFGGMMLPGCKPIARVHNWSAGEIESRLRNLMHQIGGYD